MSDLVHGKYQCNTVTIDDTDDDNRNNNRSDDARIFHTSITVCYQETETKISSPLVI
jgi:hypothetical protein